MNRSMDIRRVSRPQSAPVRQPRRSGQLAWVFLLLLMGLGGSWVWANQRGYLRLAADQPAPANSTSLIATTTPLKRLRPTDFFGPPIPTASPPSSPDSTPTPSVTPTIAKTDIRLRILNGSGIAGQANQLKAELEQAGFNVRTTGTAKNRRQTTILYYQAGERAQAELVASSIVNRQVELFENDALAAPDDVLIVVGNR